jgi:hypothetical protein
VDHFRVENVHVGTVFIAGKKYSNSFYEDICINTPIDIVIPPGYSKIVGEAGYSDDSGFKGGVTLQVQATTDPVESGSDESTFNWIRLDEISIDPRHGTPFSDSLPKGTTAIQLSAVDYACSTQIAWGNPAVK